MVELADLPAFGRPAHLMWHKVRWFCANAQCDMTSWTWADARIVAPRQAMTDRAARWATLQVGRLGRPVAEVARELDCDWHTVSDAVLAYGSVIVDDTGRIGPSRHRAWTRPCSAGGAGGAARSSVYLHRRRQPRPSRPAIGCGPRPLRHRPNPVAPGSTRGLA